MSHVALQVILDHCLLTLAISVEINYLQNSTSFPLVQLGPTAECLLLSSLGLPIYATTTPIEDANQLSLELLQQLPN